MRGSGQRKGRYRDLLSPAAARRPPHKPNLQSTGTCRLRLQSQIPATVPTTAASAIDRENTPDSRRALSHNGLCRAERRFVALQADPMDQRLRPLQPRLRQVAGRPVQISPQSLRIPANGPHVRSQFPLPVQLNGSYELPQVGRPYPRRERRGSAGHQAAFSTAGLRPSVPPAQSLPSQSFVFQAAGSLN
jgi:hypothetical protein